LLGQALERGSVSFLAHYLCAQKFRLASGFRGSFNVRVKGEQFKEIRSELQNRFIDADFGGRPPFNRIFSSWSSRRTRLGREALAAAIQLEPENLSYLLSLAQAQLLREMFRRRAAPWTFCARPLREFTTPAPCPGTPAGKWTTRRTASRWPLNQPDRAFWGKHPISRRKCAAIVKLS